MTCFNKTRGILCLVLSMLLPLIGRAQSAPPDFSASKTSGCAPESISFSALNVPAGATCSWVFEKDTVRNKSNATHIFAASGMYDVLLMIEQAGKSPIQILKKGFIHLGHSRPSVPFTVSRKQLCSGLDTVTLSANVSGVAQYDWIVDGSDYTNASPKIVHKFLTTGYKRISLRILDSLGCYTIKTIDSMVYVAQPATPDFSVDKAQGCTPLTVKVTNRTRTGSSPILSYDWFFEGAKDSVFKTQTPPQLLYNKEGAFDISLTLTTKDGCKYNVLRKDFIRVGFADTPTFTVDKPTPCPSEIVTFKVKAKDTTGQFTWDIPGAYILSSSAKEARVIYTKGGDYNVTISQSRGGCVASHTKQPAVSVTNIKANFSATPDCGCRVPDTVQFKNLSDTPAIGQMSYEWTFYDSNGVDVISTSSEANPSIVFKKYGIYSVKLVVRHSSGCADSIMKRSLLKFLPLDTATFKLSKRFACKQMPLTFIPPAVVTCNNMKFKYFWTFYAKDGKTILDTSSKQNPKIAYNDTGDYDIHLSVKTPTGCEMQKRFFKAVSVVIPTPGFGVDTAYACRNGNGATLESKMDPAGIPYAHKWTVTLASDTTVVLKGTSAKFRPNFTRPGVYHVRYQAGVDPYCSYNMLKSNYLYISGIKGDFKAAKVSGCLPFTTQLTGQVTENVHFTDTSSAVTYMWSASPSTGVTFSNPTGLNTDITITANGCFAITLKMTNSSGCTEVVSKKNYICAGVQARFAMPAQACAGDAITLSNSSSANSIRWQWSSPSANVVFYPSDKARAPRMIISDTGTFKVKLVAWSDAGCIDSFSKTIGMKRIKVDFSAPARRYSCAPAYVSFTANCPDAVSYIWYFGDGDSLITNLTNIAHLYRTNSGDSTKGFDVKLIAISKLGCRDTMLKDKYIQVIGPVPAFEMSNQRGCEPLTVAFKDKSQYAEKLYFDYNEGGNVVEGNTYSNYTYTITNPYAEYQVFRPRLLAKDKYDCSAWANSPDSVVVYRRPQPDFKVSATGKCYPFAIQFRDSSRFAAKRYWDFDNDGKIDDTAHSPKVMLKPGKYTVKLIVENRFGCRDSLVVDNVLDILPGLGVKLAVNKDTFCSNEPITVKCQTDLPSLVKEYRWYLDSNLLDPSRHNGAELRFSIQKPGFHQIEVEVVNLKGCGHRVALGRSLFIPDTSRVNLSPISYVTVEDDSSITIRWRENVSHFFNKYLLQRTASASFATISAYNHPKLTLHQDRSDINPNKSAYSYTLRTEDVCGNVSQMATVHRTMHLNVRTDGFNRLLLTWNAYRGWGSVREYRVFKQQPGGDFKLFAILKAGDTSVVDNAVCDNNYRYRVEAVSPTAEEYISRSNTVSGRPQYLYQTKILEMNYASVREEQDIIINWESAQQTNVKSYLVDKFDPTRGWMHAIDSTTETMWIDRNVQTNQSIYLYRVRVKDECLNISKPSKISHNILLTAREKDDKIHLKWTKYMAWENGVSNYHLEYLNASGAWTPLKTFSSTDTTYIDGEVKEGMQGPYKYRIIAEENVANGSKSVSNVAKAILPSRVFVPNAFSPNNDGVNDVFKPEGLFLQNIATGVAQYTFTIFNRWGEKIFETHKLEEGWNGTYREADSPNDAYIYELSATGHDNKDFFLKGTFYLLR